MMHRAYNVKFERCVTPLLDTRSLVENGVLRMFQNVLHDARIPACAAVAVRSSLLKNFFFSA